MALALHPRFVADITPGPSRRADAAVYVRRRIAAVLGLIVALLVVLGGVVAAEHILAGRGGVPAYAPTAQPVQSEPYVVQLGDTLWSIGRRFHGDRSLGSYVEALVRANDGDHIEVGQQLQLP